jgi:hypothetical protein
MKNTANTVSAEVAARPNAHLLAPYKRRIKNVLFPVPGVRKFLIATRQKIEHLLYGLNGPGDDALFENKINPGMPRAMVASIPKSGTYLLHGILKELGLVPSGVHLGESGYYDQRDEATRRTYFGEVKLDSPLIATAKRLGPGQVTASHLLYLPENVKTLSDFRLFFSFRESRAVFVSLMRYFSNPGLGEEFGAAWKNEPDDKKRMEKFLELYAPITIRAHADIAGWVTDKKTLPVKYETLCGDEGEDAQLQLVKKIAAHVDVSLTDDQARNLISKVVGGGSRTWSGKRSDVNQYWSERTEQIFQKNGGQRLNARLGYP